MKSLVLRSCILGPYVPLRTSSKRKRVANELYSASRNQEMILCKLTGHNLIWFLTLQPYNDIHDIS